MESNRCGTGSGRTGSRLTKLEVGVVGTDVVAGTEQTLHHQGSPHSVEQTKVFGDATFLGVKRERKNEPMKFRSFLLRLPASYQRVQIVADQGTIVDHVPLEDDEEEEESQHHIADVAEDVVERTLCDNSSELVTETKTRHPPTRPSADTC